MGSGDRGAALRLPAEIGLDGDRAIFGRVEEFLARHSGGRIESWREVSESTAELR